MYSRYVHDHGMELVQVPIKRVRVIRLDGRWCVQCQRASKWIGWYWFTLSIHSNTDYYDARKQADLLTNNGYYTTLKYKKEVFEVETK